MLYPMLMETPAGEEAISPYYLLQAEAHLGQHGESSGFCRDDDKVSVYNIRIMEEAQSILALGAGGMSKSLFS